MRGITIKKNESGAIEFVIVLVLIAFLIGGVFYWRFVKPQTNPTNKSLQKVTLQLNWLHQTSFAGFYMAREKGFYRDAGLDIEFKEFSEGMDISDELADGKSNYAITTPLEIISSYEMNKKTVAVAALYQTSPYSFISLKDKAITTPSDLKGKRLGNAGNNSEAKVLYATLLKNAGIAESDAKVVPVSFDIVSELTSGKVDIVDTYRIDGTYWLEKSGVPYAQLLPEQFGFDIYGDLLAVGSTYANEHKDQVKAFVQASLKGWDYALNNQKETVTVAMNYAVNDYKNEEYLAHILKSSEPLIRPTANKQIGSMDFIPWNRAYQATKASGKLPNGFDVGQAYTTEYLKK
ncbi:MAG: thiamine biosynthesis protein [Candidatus Saccharibacteria bacterium]|nr:thiamine biosynthesis protein [Candidatus Saccharibacteria bacterium]